MDCERRLAADGNLLRFVSDERNLQRGIGRSGKHKLSGRIGRRTVRGSVDHDGSPGDGLAFSIDNCTGNLLYLGQGDHNSPPQYGN